MGRPDNDIGRFEDFARAFTGMIVRGRPLIKDTADRSKHYFSLF
jgi:hypothetical protein